MKGSAGDSEGKGGGVTEDRLTEDTTLSTSRPRSCPVFLKVFLRRMLCAHWMSGAGAALMREETRIFDSLIMAMAAISSC